MLEISKSNNTNFSLLYNVITFHDMKMIYAKFFNRANFEKLSQQKVTHICRNLAEKTGDDEMKKKVDNQKVRKEEMIDYCKEKRNIEKISSAKDFEEYLETEEFQEFDDFSEFRQGSSEQISEMCSCKVNQGGSGRQQDSDGSDER